jgi:hypothetical protein
MHFEWNALILINLLLVFYWLFTVFTPSLSQLAAELYVRAYS